MKSKSWACGLAALALGLLLALCGCAAGGAGRPAGAPFTLVVAHVNDTHSALEPAQETLAPLVDGRPMKLRAALGGMARLKAELDRLRAAAPADGGPLFLHAGDAVQGTLYYNVFEGAAEMDFLNLLGVDAMALGNHEFDKGVDKLSAMLAKARFPVLSANIDAGGEPALAGRIGAHAQFTRAGRGIAVIGSTTPATPYMTAGVGRARFLDPAAAVAPLAARLRAQGASVVILLSHNGYEADLELARTVPGLDLIVGGHTHTLLGSREALGALGLSPAGAYPTEVAGPDGRRVLVVQAWKWGEALGRITLRYGADGRLEGYEAAPLLLAAGPLATEAGELAPGSREYAAARAALEASGALAFGPQDPAALAMLAPYREKVAAMQGAPIGARAVVDLVRGSATDPGPLVADAYLAAVPGARLSLTNPGGLRKDLLAGEITLGAVMGVLPFANTLVAMDITGAQLKEALEQSVEFRLKTRPVSPADNWAELGRLLMHPGGFSYLVRPDAPYGQRIAELRLLGADGRAGAPLDLAASYRLVTNGFLAGGGDGLATLKAVTAGRQDTGLLDSDALADLLRRLGTVSAPAGGPRARIAPAGAHSLLAPRPRLGHVLESWGPAWGAAA